tara:strand:+ start:1139 stop:2380 length:1242 start_codon:yes stop_codon:yes gene_type:complete
MCKSFLLLVLSFFVFSSHASAAKGKLKVYIIVNGEKETYQSIYQKVNSIANDKKIKKVDFIVYHATSSPNANQKSSDLENNKNFLIYRPYPKDCKFSNCNWLDNIVPTMFSNDVNNIFYCNGSLNCSPNSWGMTSMNLPSAELIKIQEKIKDYLVNKANKKKQSSLIFYLSKADGLDELNPTVGFEDTRMTISTNDMDQVLTPLYSKDVAIYSWSPSAGLSCSDCPNPTIIDPQDRTYTVTVWDKDKCKKDQAEIAIKTFNLCDCRKILSMSDEFDNVFSGKQIREKYKKNRSRQTFYEWQIISLKSGGWVFEYLVTATCFESYRVTLTIDDRPIWQEDYLKKDFDSRGMGVLHEDYPDHFVVKLDFTEIHEELEKAKRDKKPIRIKIEAYVDGEICDDYRYASPKLIFTKCN